MLILAGAAVSSQSQGEGSTDGPPKGGDLNPALRKATRNMRFAVECVERALQQASNWLGLDFETIALIVGTNSGELDTSAEFLLTHAKSGLARPLLFQNSLHNSTAGFLSIHFGLRGPIFTISSGERTPGDCVELAHLLMESGQCRAAVVVLVESHKMLAELACPSERLAEGAACLVFGAGVDSELSASSDVKCESEFLSEDITTEYQVRPEFAPLIDITASGFFRAAIDWSRSALQRSGAAVVLRSPDRQDGSHGL